MNRRRASRRITGHDGDNRVGKVNGTVIQDLPDFILTDILFKLSVKRILICKRVCKPWYELISCSIFAKAHYEKAEVCPMIRTSSPVGVSRILYAVEPEHNDDFDLSFCHCYNEGFAGDFSKHAVKKCCHHINLKLDTKFKLPLRNFDDRDGTDEMIHLHLAHKGNSLVKLNPKDHKYMVANSCNGLLCLSEPANNKPVAICNPITGELINLPEDELPEYPTCFLGHKSFVCGLGYSPVTNQYKVVQIFSCTSWSAVHTVGTESWREIKTYPVAHSKLEYTTYLNGAIHWLCRRRLTAGTILVFNIADESFKSISPPVTKEGPLMSCYHRGANVSFGTLAGRLCICDAQTYVPIDIWIMMDYGVVQSWIKLLTIPLIMADPWIQCTCVPLKYMSSGGVLLFNRHENAIVYYEPVRNRLKFRKLHGSKLPLEVFTHTPSFVSLRNMIWTDDLQVHNTKSRYLGLKLQGEVRNFSLVEQGPEWRGDEDLDD